jgi:hypothetical protein
MTVSNQSSSVTIIANGTQTAFNFSFEIPFESDGLTPAVQVFTQTAGVITQLALYTGFTITGTGNTAGGTVTIPGPLAANTQVIIQRAQQIVQPNAFPNTSFFPSTVEAALDFLTLAMQQLSPYGAYLPGPYTVATLPAQPRVGAVAFVTDATAYTPGIVAVGGGTITAPVFFGPLGWIVL